MTFSKRARSSGDMGVAPKSRTILSKSMARALPVASTPPETSKGLMTCTCSDLGAVLESDS